MCIEEIEKLFKPKNMINAVTMPGASFNDFNIINLRYHPRANDLLELNFLLHQGANTPFTRISSAQFSNWINYPDHLFIAVTYKSSFLGFLFVLRLLPKSFKKILDFSTRKKDLNESDFASLHEDGSLYILSLYSLSPIIATKLFQRFYAHLITYQKHTKEVGFISSYEEARTLAKRLGLSNNAQKEIDNTTIQAFHY